MAVIITEEMLKNADSYLSISQKEGLAYYLAKVCVEEKDGLYYERYSIKQQVMLGVLAQLYLHQEIDKQKVNANDGTYAGVLDCCMSESEFDNWAGSHVYAQINRIVKKGGAELGDKAYEMLNDHKTFGIMLDREINKIITEKNDPVNRIMSILSTAVTPENIQNTIADIQKQLEEVEKMKGGKANE